MVGERLKELLGILLIGDGVLAAIAPHRHPGLWLDGPLAYQRFLKSLMDRPALKRTLGLGQVGLGIWIAARQWPR